MPSKHIDGKLYEIIKNEQLRLTILTKEPIKDSFVIKALIIKGLQEIKDEDYKMLMNE